MSWTIHVGNERSELEQAMVSRHERLHHELHQTTPWGLAMTHAASDAAGPFGPAVWRWLAEGCVVTHEAFATWFSLRADDRYEALLASNAVYLGYAHQAERLSGGSRSDKDRAVLVDVLLRAAMSPAALQDVPLYSLPSLSFIELDLVAPDRRLARMAGAVEDGLLAGLATPVDRDEVIGLLGAAGVSTMTREQHRAWATELVAELNRAGPGRYAVSASGDPHDGEMDDFQRERVRLAPEPLPLVPVSPDDEGWSVEWLARADESIGAHAWLVWMLPAMLGRQFIVDPELLERDTPLLGFLGIDRVNGPPMARFWSFPLLSPSIVATGMGNAGQLRVLFFTTQATLAASEADVLDGISPVFVLVDGPLERLVADARSDGAALGWRGARLSGSRDLGVLVLERDDRPGVYYLVVTSLAGHEAFVRWLGLRASDVAQQSAEVAAEHAGHLKALLDHLVGSFWELDLLATTEQPST